MTAPGTPQGWPGPGTPVPGPAAQAHPGQVIPGQQGYPVQPGYPPQQGYPPQGPGGAPGYGTPGPVSPGPVAPGPVAPGQYPPAQQPYAGPAQPGRFGRQPGRPTARFAGGFTATGEVRLAVRANPVGAGVAGLGLVLALVGGLALDWIEGTKLPDLVEYAWNGGGLGDSNSVQTIAAFAYAAGVSYLLIVLAAYQSLMITLGGVRTRASSRIVFGLWGSLAWNSDNPVNGLRLVSVIGGVMVLALHIWGVVAIFDGSFDQASAGPWVFLAGAVMFPIAGAIGPRTVAPVDQPPGPPHG